MKIKLDENLPSALEMFLRRLGHDVHTVHKENLMGRPDHEVWQAAQTESRFLMTQDLDFSDLRLFSPGSHHGILLLRLRSPGRRTWQRVLRKSFKLRTFATGLVVLLSQQSVKFEC
jgi:predicted nuclease of predicted toxin-antitoxin system